MCELMTARFFERRQNVRIGRGGGGGKGRQLERDFLIADLFSPRE